MGELFFKELFTDDTHVVFAFHGYPGAVHQLMHGRPNTDRFHVRGFTEEGTTTTPFDMVVRNRVSRFHLVMDALNNTHRLPPGAAAVSDWCQQQLSLHEAYVVEHLEDMPQVHEWVIPEERG
jgi:xylulose-5-phosphate/fructose-6-phosphate phosphoketolase